MVPFGPAGGPTESRSSAAILAAIAARRQVLIPNHFLKKTRKEAKHGEKTLFSEEAMPA
jgi:hypothetical protein